MEEFKRFEMLIGKENLEKLSKKHIAIFGIGGVGGYVCEALARSGIGNFTLIDNDVVDVSNLNRQIIATTSTIGLPKVEVMKERILSINKEAKINTYQCFFCQRMQVSLIFQNLITLLMRLILLPQNLQLSN